MNEVFFLEENTTFYPGNSTRLIAIVFGNLYAPPLLLYSCASPVQLLDNSGTYKGHRQVNFCDRYQTKTKHNRAKIPILFIIFWNYWDITTSSSSFFEEPVFNWISYLLSRKQAESFGCWITSKKNCDSIWGVESSLDSMSAKAAS